MKKISSSLLLLLIITFSFNNSYSAEVSELIQSSKDTAQTNNEIPKSGKEIDSNLKYELGSGDKLRITVFNEPELSGEFEIDGSGILAFPLIGTIKAGGMDSRSLEKTIAEKLDGDYLVSPKVSIEVLNFRPFFILGEVKEPKSYPYVNGLTVMNAVALAGGYTSRAYTKKVIITRGFGKDRKEFKASQEELVMPGDSIRVEERLF